MSSDRERAAPRFRALFRASALVGAVGLLFCLGMAWLWPERFYPAYLTAYMFWFGIASGSVAILLLHYLVGGAWGLALRRPLEAGAITLIPLALLFIPIGLGMHHLYEWADASVVAASVDLTRKQAYLNPEAFLIRAAGYFTLWITAALLLNRWSSRQDGTDDPAPTKWLEAFSGPALVLYFLSTTFAMIDWLMSLEPAWASTIYGAMLIVGHGLGAFAFMTAVAAYLGESGFTKRAAERETSAELGNLLLSFIMLWAYMAFSQFLIVWSGNLSDEIPWYVRRMRGGWQWVAIGLIAFHFVAPAAILFSQEAKRKLGVLLRVSIVVVALRFVDLCWLILPARFEPRLTHIPWDEVGMALVAVLGIGGTFMATFSARLASRPLESLRTVERDRVVGLSSIVGEGAR